MGFRMVELALASGERMDAASERSVKGRKCMAVAKRRGKRLVEARVSRGSFHALRRKVQGDCRAVGMSMVRMKWDCERASRSVVSKSGGRECVVD